MKNIIHSTQHILKNCIDIIFPSQCLVCNTYLEDKHILCEQCTLTIPIESALYCAVCEKRLSSFTVCHPSALDAIGYAASYHVPLIRDLIHLYKYEYVRSAVVDLSNLLNSYLAATRLFAFLHTKKNNAIIIPIPLHILRERIRGFNQATLLGEQIARANDIILHDILMRTHNNPPQAQMKLKTKRIENAENLFALKPNASHLAQDKIILLIDDVATSCATLTSAAKILKQNGAKKVIGIVLAKG